MEFVLKGVLSIVILFGCGWLLRQVWHSQIDVGQSVRNAVSEVIPKLPDTIAVRDPNSIYQNGEKVGDVQGEFIEEAEFVSFPSIANTQKLKFDQPFEFRRLRLAIVKIDTQIGMKSDGRSVQNAVIEGVACKRLP